LLRRLSINSHLRCHFCGHSFDVRTYDSFMSSAFLAANYFLSTCGLCIFGFDAEIYTSMFQKILTCSVITPLLLVELITLLSSVQFSKNISRHSESEFRMVA